MRSIYALSIADLRHLHACPLSLSRFSRSFLARVSSLSLSLLSLPLASVLSSRSFSLSPFSHACLPLRVFSLSLSLTLTPSRSRRSAGSAHFTCRVMSRAAYPVPPFRPFRRQSLRISSRPPRHVASLPCHVSRGVPSAIVPPLPPAIAPHPVASAAPRRVASRPRGVYTPPRWEQIGSIPATIYPRVLGQLPSCAGLGVRRCNRTMRGVPCCNRSRKRPEQRRKGSQRQSVEGREASGWAQRTRRTAEGGDEVGERCAVVIGTALGCCMRCAQSAAGESPPNPKVQHVHYDTGPRATGNRRACGCCGAPVRKRPVLQISQNIAHPGRTENSTPGPMSVLPRQLHQRSHRRTVESIRGVKACTRGDPNPPASEWVRSPSPKLERREKRNVLIVSILFAFRQLVLCCVATHIGPVKVLWDARGTRSAARGWT